MTRLCCCLPPGEIYQHIEAEAKWLPVTDDTFKCIFLNENVILSIQSSLKFVPKGPNNDIPALVQIMAWRRPGDKPLSEPMMVRLLTHICVTRPQWVNPRHTSAITPSCSSPVNGIGILKYVDFDARSRYLKHGLVIASHNILLDVFT